MSRRKGERPVSTPLDRWTPAHPVANAMATGARWFMAWAGQKATPYIKPTKLTDIPAARLAAIDAGDCLSRAELDALARAWSVSAADLVASMPDPSLVID